MQTLHSFKSRNPWTINEQKFPLSLYYKSPTIYSFLRNKLEITLPGISTIKHWIDNSKFLPGYNNNFIKQIEIKIGTLTPIEKYCIVAFDEMKIKSFLEYSKALDLVESFENLGHLGRKNK